jgi:peptidoglycan/xylan/chitin deacetylase (PgdA/CDA1 family)
MTGVSASQVLKALAGLLGFFTVAYLAPDTLLHRLGLRTMTSARARRACALTFDDGPDPVFTPLVLDTLKDHRCRATFFVLGKKAAANPGVMARMAREGHEIGIHGWDHRHPWLFDPLTCAIHLRRTLRATAQYREPSARPKYRPPWGFWSVWTLMASRGLKRVMWSLPGDDWKRGATPASVAEHVSTGIREGSIVLIHDGGRYSGTTAAALPAILTGMEAIGLRQVTVGELEDLAAAQAREGESWGHHPACAENPVKRAARKLQDLVEARFEARRHLVPCGESGLVRIETLVYEGPGVWLRSGAVIRNGALIGEIHLDSRKIAGMYRQEPAMRAMVRIFRDAESAFVWIARWLTGDEAGLKVEAVYSTTLLDRQMEHFGFEVLPLPAWPWVLMGIYMHWLSFLYRAGGKAPRRKDPAPLLKRLTPRQVWMTRDDFLRRFSAARLPAHHEDVDSGLALA